MAGHLEASPEGEILRLAAAEGDARLERLIEALDRLLGLLVGHRQVDPVRLALDGRLVDEADHELILAHVAALVGQGRRGREQECAGQADGQGRREASEEALHTFDCPFRRRRAAGWPPAGLDL